MKQNSTLSLSILTAATLIFSSCSHDKDMMDEIRNRDRNLNSDKSTFIYNMVPQNSSAKISTEYSEAINRFSLSLLNEIYLNSDHRDENIVMSPFSISRNLSVIAEGASGVTRDELLSTLGGEVALNDAKDALTELLYSDTSVTLQCADAIWFNSDKYELNSSFEQRVKSKYGVEVAGLSFTDIPLATNSVNSWINKNTNGKVPNFISQKDLTPVPAALIANAIYFEADWSSPFDISDTKSEPFTTPHGVVTAYMMSSNYQHKTYKSDEYHNAKLYYGSDSEDFFYLDIYMPTGISMQEFIAEKSQRALSIDSTEFSGLTLPKFDFTTEIDLKETFQSLGVNRLFTPGNSDLDGIFESGTGFYIEKIMHKAGIKTDEEGTEAFAVALTAVGDGAAPESPDVLFDKPFVYFIRAGSNGLVLFSGIVNDPTKR